jgi:hypothetical protein
MLLVMVVSVEVVGREVLVGMAARRWRGVTERPGRQEPNREHKRREESQSTHLRSWG